MATFSHISGAEPSTITFKAATVTLPRNSSVMHQELISLADPESSLSIARISSAAPASSDAGLVVRQVGYSTVVSVAAMPAGSTSVTIAAITGPVSTAAPATSDTGLIVRQVGYSTIVSVAALPANSSQVEVRAMPANSSVVAISGPTSTAAPAANDTGVVVRVVGYSTIVSVAAFPANSSQVEVRALPANSSQVAITGPTSTAAPASNDTGVVVRQVGYSTVVTVAAMPAGSTTVSVANSPTVLIGTNLQSTVAPSSGSSGLVTREVYDVRSNAASTSAFATSTQFTISGSTAQAKYVTAYSITSTDLTATVLRFMGGSTLAWPVRMQATSSAITGANLAGMPYLFKTDAASSLTLNISGSSRAGWTVAVSYFLAP